MSLSNLSSFPPPLTVPMVLIVSLCTIGWMNVLLLYWIGHESVEKYLHLILLYTGLAMEARGTLILEERLAVMMISWQIVLCGLGIRLEWPLWSIQKGVALGSVLLICQHTTVLKPMVPFSVRRSCSFEFKRDLPISTITTGLLVFLAWFASDDSLLSWCMLVVLASSTILFPSHSWLLICHAIGLLIEHQCATLGDFLRVVLAIVGAL